jgi:Flp pilus assembly protein TadG
VDRVDAVPGPGSAERGAVAVEFALVVPILVLLLFGIVDYGLWFQDSIALRQGVREGARQGIVENFGTDRSCTGASASANVKALICRVKSDAGTATGRTYVKVEVLDADGDAGVVWEQGGTLRVCAMTADTGGTGFVPLPAGGVITSRVDMRIEQELSAGATGAGGGEESPPPGKDWLWCDA